MASVSSPDAGLERSVAAAIAGDAGAFAELVAASQSAVTSIALAICRDVATSEDVAQEVYLLAWRRLGELRNPSSFLPWIRQMTRFTAKTRMRDRGTEDRHLGAPSYGALDDLLAQAADPRPGADAELLHRERLDLVADTLSELPDESREVLVLFHREGRSTRQVASLLGLSEAVVRKRLERGRRRLRSDVLERFAEAARTTAPGAAFTAAVMALTAAGAPT
ncbi:MAG: sigma-70 family RNA polymerase sigma factor, partial [Acidobacteriota bacterium]